MYVVLLYNSALSKELTLLASGFFFLVANI